MKCDKCKKDFSEEIWESGKTYKGIDEHHNPPQFMFEDEEVWKGVLYNLCREHHRFLHDKIIKILNQEAGTLKFLKSEYYVWLKMNKIQKLSAREKIFEFTENFIKEEKNGDTNSEGTT